MILNADYNEGVFLNACHTADTALTHVDYVCLHQVCLYSCLAFMFYRSHIFLSSVLYSFPSYYVLNFLWVAYILIHYKDIEDLK